MDEQTASPTPGTLLERLAENVALYFPEFVETYRDLVRLFIGGHLGLSEKEARLTQLIDPYQQATFGGASHRLLKLNPQQIRNLRLPQWLLDIALLQLFATDRDRLVHALYKTYINSISVFVASHLGKPVKNADVEDCVASIFTSIWVAINNKETETLREFDNFGSWIRTISRHEVENFQKEIVLQQQRSIEGEEAEKKMELEVQTIFDDPEPALERTINAEEAVAYIETLPDPYRTVIYLRSLEQKKSQEIMQQLRIPDVNVRTIKQRGIEKLRQYARVQRLLTSNPEAQKDFSTLSERSKMIVSQHFLDGLALEQIAAINGWEIEMVKKSLYRGIQALCKYRDA